MLRSVIVMVFLLMPMALGVEQRAAGESQWSEYLNHDYHFRVKYPSCVNRIEERGRDTVRMNPISPSFRWRENNLLLNVDFSFGDAAANMTTGLMWIFACSNSGHTDLKSSTDSIMRPYTGPGLHVRYDTCTVAGVPAILAETWDGWQGEMKTDLLETYVFQHQDVVFALMIVPFNFVSGRGDTLGLGGDKRDYVVRSFGWICH
jgi:hypothetical protein